MSLNSVHTFLYKSRALLQKAAEELFVMESLNSLNAMAYVDIVKLYNSLFEEFLIMDKRYGWIDNLSRIPIRKTEWGPLLKAPSDFDKVLELQVEQTSEWIDVVNNKIKTTGVTKKFFRLGYIEGTKIALNRMEIIDTFNLMDLPIDEAFLARKTVLDNAMADDIINSVNNTVADLYVNEGMHPDAIARKIRKLVPETYKNRARTIARTETNFAASNAQYDTYKRNGITTKELLLESDACSICTDAKADMDSSNIDATALDTFGQYVMYPPFHPSCRCAIVPSVSFTPPSLSKKDKILLKGEPKI